MVRQRKSKHRGPAMTQREAELQAVGIAFGGAAGDARPLSGGHLLSDSGLSGYGAYRPITVRPYSMPEHAHLERDQRRD